MIEYEFEIPEAVTGKARPRMNIRSGKAYTPTKTKNYEYLTRYYFVEKYPKFVPIENRVQVKITAYYEITKSTSRKQETKMLQDKISPTKKPDIDNIAKIILDSLNKFAYKDDTQVTKLEIEKKYATTPKVIVKIIEY